MPQSTFDDDELFAEATEEMQADVEDALTRVNEHLPTAGDLFSLGDETLPVVLDSLEAELTIEPVEKALTDAQKAFLVGKRADAFDAEYVTETEATIAEFRDTIATLREIETATVDLTDALSTFEDLASESQLESPPSSETQSDSVSGSDVSETGDEPTDAATDSADEASGQDNKEGNKKEATTKEAGQADLTDTTDE